MLESLQEDAGIDDTGLKTVIADFLNMGHVDNIVAMFRRGSEYYAWTGELLNDSRLQVRLGMAVLFEELREVDAGQIDLAIPSLVHLLETVPPLPSYVRGDALGVLEIIGSPLAMAAVRAMVTDSDPQVAEMAKDILGEDV